MGSRFRLEACLQLADLPATKLPFTRAIMSAGCRPMLSLNMVHFFLQKPMSAQRYECRLYSVSFYGRCTPIMT